MPAVMVMPVQVRPLAALGTNGRCCAALLHLRVAAGQSCVSMHATCHTARHQLSAYHGFPMPPLQSAILNPEAGSVFAAAITDSIKVGRLAGMAGRLAVL